MQGKFNKYFKKGSRKRPSDSHGDDDVPEPKRPSASRESKRASASREPKRPSNSREPKGPSDAADENRDLRREIAAETRNLAPKMLAQLTPRSQASAPSTVHHLKDHGPLSPKSIPTRVKIRVVNDDSIDEAIRLQPGTNVLTAFPLILAHDSDADDEAEDVTKSPPLQLPSYTTIPRSLPARGRKDDDEKEPVPGPSTTTQSLPTQGRKDDDEIEPVPGPSTSTTTPPPRPSSAPHYSKPTPSSTISVGKLPVPAPIPQAISRSTFGSTRSLTNREGTADDYMRSLPRSSPAVDSPLSTVFTKRTRKPRPTGLKPVLVLNLANERQPGGGWLNGAIAQEESLFYRTTLSASLPTSLYPIPTLSCLYTPVCLLFRRSPTDQTYDTTHPLHLPLVSVISAAALYKPRLARDDHSNLMPVYAHAHDEEIMKYKMRLVLRVAAMHGHRKIVLGAWGCGAFKNPAVEVVRLFYEVFQEPEFGGWWDDVVFAVRDGEGGTENGMGNFDVFYRGLSGVDVPQRD